MRVRRNRSAQPRPANSLEITRRSDINDAECLTGLVASERIDRTEHEVKQAVSDFINSAGANNTPASVSIYEGEHELCITITLESGVRPKEPPPAVEVAEDKIRRVAAALIRAVGAALEDAITPPSSTS